MSDRIEQIQQKLEQALKPTHLQVFDDSQAHIGHAGAASGAGHFTVEIASAEFIDKTPVQRHQLVYQALGNMMEHDIHALRIIAKLPDEA